MPVALGDCAALQCLIAVSSMFAPSSTKLLLINHWILEPNNKLNLPQCSSGHRGPRSMDMLPAKNDASSISASLRPPGSLAGLQRIADLAVLPFSLERASYELMHRMWLRANNQSEGLYFGIQGLQ